jgi:hypothetical protein
MEPRAAAVNEVFAAYRLVTIHRHSQLRRKPMFGSRSETRSEPRKEIRPPVVRDPSCEVINDAQRLLELQDKVREIYQEIGQIKKRIRAAKSPSAATHDPSCGS